MAKLYCISYDLIKEKDYSKLIDAIKTYKLWWHQTGSVWYVVSENQDSVQIRDSLMQYLDADDKLFVIRINWREWAGTGFTKDEYDWLRNRMDELNIQNK